MANVFPSRGDFLLPSELIDEHEWMADFLLDGETGHTCTLYYPSKPTECDNCLIDPSTGRSSHIYKVGGPIPFQNYTVCPRCGGSGRNVLPQTEEISLRVYWNSKDWIDVGPKFDVADGVAMTIGYMTDLPAMEKAEKILLNTDVQEMRRWLCERMGEAVPHGFRQKRYFIQYVKRIGGG
jgi:hypothetical protein